MASRPHEAIEQHHVFAGENGPAVRVARCGSGQTLGLMCLTQPSHVFQCDSTSKAIPLLLTLQSTLPAIPWGRCREGWATATVSQQLLRRSWTGQWLAFRKLSRRHGSQEQSTNVHRLGCPGVCLGSACCAARSRVAWARPPDGTSGFGGAASLSVNMQTRTWETVARIASMSLLQEASFDRVLC